MGTLADRRISRTVHGRACLKHRHMDANRWGTVVSGDGPRERDDGRAGPDRQPVADFDSGPLRGGPGRSSRSPTIADCVAALCGGRRGGLDCDHDRRSSQSTFAANAVVCDRLRRRYDDSGLASDSTGIGAARSVSRSSVAERRHGRRGEGDWASHRGRAGRRCRTASRIRDQRRVIRDRHRRVDGVETAAVSTGR